MKEFFKGMITFRLVIAIYDVMGLSFINLSSGNGTKEVHVAPNICNSTRASGSTDCALNKCGTLALVMH